MKTIAIIVLTAAVITSLPGRAEAQSSSFLKDNLAKMIRKVGLHLNGSYRLPTDKDVTKGVSFGVSVGLSPGLTNGWRYPVGLTLFRVNLQSPNGREFAYLRSLALLGGIGYGWHFGKLSTGASLQAGYAAFSVRPQGDVLGAFDLPAGTVTMDVSNAPLIRPQVKAEYFIKPKFTVRVSFDYMWIKPDVTVTTPKGTFSGQWDASNYHANAGIAYYPWRR